MGLQSSAQEIQEFLLEFLANQAGGTMEIMT